MHFICDLVDIKLLKLSPIQRSSNSLNICNYKAIILNDLSKIKTQLVLNFIEVFLANLI